MVVLLPKMYFIKTNHYGANEQTFRGKHPKHILNVLSFPWLPNFPGQLPKFKVCGKFQENWSKTQISYSIIVSIHTTLNRPFKTFLGDQDRCTKRGAGSWCHQHDRQSIANLSRDKHWHNSVRNLFFLHKYQVMEKKLTSKTKSYHTPFPRTLTKNTRPCFFFEMFQCLTKNAWKVLNWSDIHAPVLVKMPN